MFENTYGVVEGGGRPGVLLCTTNTYCGGGRGKKGGNALYYNYVCSLIFLLYIYIPLTPTSVVVQHVTFQSGHISRGARTYS